MTQVSSTLYSPITTSALYRRFTFLNRPDLLAKVNELRSRVEVYLRGINSTFSHFTSHAIDHGDQIVRELSSLLYEDVADQNSVSVQLNATECYLLVISAYLHDAGMVVTDEEKYSLLASPAWHEFAESNTQAQADFNAMEQELTSRAEASSAAPKLYLAGLEQRLLLAEYFRRQHAARAANAINGALNVTSDFLGGDPAVGKTVTAICVGHGLNRAELASEVSYPTRRDLLGEPVNVRLLAVLLRLGDLLDMRFDRACPLLSSLASPLPKSSEVHWSQYGCITSRITSPSVISIRAECGNVDEYRLLRDWCTWLADEVRDAPKILAGGLRHPDWQPPKASIGDSQDTIQVVRAQGTTYRTEDWRFTLDEPEVISRLVNDVHRADRFGFIKELLQNALDSVRARAYVESQDTQPYPNLLPASLREKYPIEIELVLRGDKVVRTVVADSGIGMTPDTIQNYFLQVGRSWYRSKEFLSRWSFAPTSRFGVGFLSVFAVSEDVSVLTRWYESKSDESILMRLPGPRSYLVFEDAERSSPGTSVTVHLTEPVDLSAMRSYLIDLCQATEFPLNLSVRSETGTGTVSTISLPLEVTEIDPKFALDDYTQCYTEVLELAAHGVFGRFKFLSIKANGVPDWSISGSSLVKLVGEKQPLLEFPELEEPSVAINGLRATRSWRPNDQTETWTADLRKAYAAQSAGLDRSNAGALGNFMDEDIGIMLDEHLDTRPHNLQYQARLVWRFETYAPTWAAAKTIFRDTAEQTYSTHDLLARGTFQLGILVKQSYERHAPYVDRLKSFSDSWGGPILFPLNGLVSYSRRQSILGNFRPLSVQHVFDRLFVVEFGRHIGSGSPRSEVFRASFAANSSVVKLELPTEAVVINQTHPLIKEIDKIEKSDPAVSKILLGEIIKKHYYTSNLAAALRAAADHLNNGVIDYFASLVEHQGVGRLIAPGDLMLEMKIPPSSKGID